jgi:HD superfamily phosphohydrolase
LILSLPSVNNYNADYWQISSIRDPLYGFIDLTERELALLESFSMQRLTRIKQLSHTYLVYPGATHTRFEHSLGTMFIADRMCSRFGIENERREIIRCAALLHDVGHGPFSHLFEIPLAKWNKKETSQEEITKIFLQYDNELILPLKGDFYSVKESNHLNLIDIYDRVLDIFNGTRARDVLARSMVSGTIDADKIDYLIRDSFYTGTTYGIFDVERILATLRIVRESETTQYPVILKKGVESLESFRLARFLLYKQVYQHKTRLIADSMFVRAVELSDNEQLDKTNLVPSKGRAFVDAYKKLDDAVVIQSILCGRDGPSKSLITMLRDRKLLKQALELQFPRTKQEILTQIYSREDNLDALLNEFESRISSSCQIDSTYLFVHLEKEDSAIKMYTGFGDTAESGDIPLLYLDENKEVRPYEDISPLTLKRGPQENLRIYCPRDLEVRVRDLGLNIFSKTPASS